MNTIACFHELQRQAEPFNNPTQQRLFFGRLVVLAQLNYLSSCSSSRQPLDRGVPWTGHPWTRYEFVVRISSLSPGLYHSSRLSVGGKSLIYQRLSNLYNRLESKLRSWDTITYGD